MLSTFAAVLLSSAVATPAAVPAIDPKKMSQKQIREHNKGRDVKDPQYIRCVKSAAIGSLVERNYSCRTNAQWAAADRTGNEEARAIQDQMASKAWNTN